MSPPPPILVLAIRALVYAICAAAFTWPLSGWTTAVSAASGAFVGVLAAPALGKSRMRSSALLALTVLVGLALSLFVSLLERSQGLSMSFGDTQWLAVVDGARFGGAAALVGLIGTTFSLRHRWLAFVEVAAGGTIFSQLVSDHRHGAINRPFEIADPIIASGGDPAIVFLTLGAVAALLLALVLIWERRVGRLLVHISVLAVLLIGAFMGADATGVLPRPEPAGGGLGLTGKPQQQDDKKSGGHKQNRRDNDNLEFRDNEQSRDQQTPVAVVLLHDDYSSPTGVYYFRQGAFSQFNGRRLVGSTRDHVDEDILGSFPVQHVDVEGAPQPGYDRASLESTVALLADHTRPFGLESPIWFAPAQNPDPDRFRRVYKVGSAPLTADYNSMLGRLAGNDAWSEEDRKEYLALPSDPRYAALANEILSKLPELLKDDPMLKAWTVREWLSKEGIYSLRSKHASAEDPTAHFLFGDKTGYCVHFAHAAVYLLRAAGVPSRVATGYAVEESARQGGSAILISSGAAHAWPEIYLDEVGWVVVDVQPERTLDPPPEPADADLQRLLGQLARGVTPLAPDGTEPRLAIWAWLKDVARKLGEGLAYGLVGVLIALYLTKLWRALAPRFAPARDLARVAYRAEIDRLADLGIGRKRGESREAFAARVARDLPSFAQLTRAHVGARFGSAWAERLSKPELAAYREAVSRERRQLFSFWKRLAGSLVPWSFLRAR
jgi:transglutaminase-like putative cysteine protease